MRLGVIDDRGEVIPLPAEIEKGVADVAQRKGWNPPAAPGLALPTETWREHVARRKRCLEIRAKLRAGVLREATRTIFRFARLKDPHSVRIQSWRIRCR